MSVTFPETTTQYPQAGTVSAPGTPVVDFLVSDELSGIKVQLELETIYLGENSDLIQKVLRSSKKIPKAERHLNTHGTRAANVKSGSTPELVTIEDSPAIILGIRAVAHLVMENRYYSDSILSNLGHLIIPPTSSSNLKVSSFATSTSVSSSDPQTAEAAANEEDHKQTDFCYFGNFSSFIFTFPVEFSELSVDAKINLSFYCVDTATEIGSLSFLLFNSKGVLKQGRFLLPMEPNRVFRKKERQRSSRRAGVAASINSSIKRELTAVVSNRSQSNGSSSFSETSSISSEWEGFNEWENNDVYSYNEYNSSNEDSNSISHNPSIDSSLLSKFLFTSRKKRRSVKVKHKTEKSNNSKIQTQKEIKKSRYKDFKNLKQQAKDMGFFYQNLSLINSNPNKEIEINSDDGTTESSTFSSKSQTSNDDNNDDSVLIYGSHSCSSSSLSFCSSENSMFNVSLNQTDDDNDDTDLMSCVVVSSGSNMSWSSTASKEVEDKHQITNKSKSMFQFKATAQQQGYQEQNEGNFLPSAPVDNSVPAGDASVARNISERTIRTDRGWYSSSPDASTDRKDEAAEAGLTNSDRESEFLKLSLPKQSLWTTPLRSEKLNNKKLMLINLKNKKLKLKKIMSLKKISRSVYRTINYYKLLDLILRMEQLSSSSSLASDSVSSSSDSSSSVSPFKSSGSVSSSEILSKSLIQLKCEMNLLNSLTFFNFVTLSLPVFPLPVLYSGTASATQTSISSNNSKQQPNTFVNQNQIQTSNFISYALNSEQKLNRSLDSAAGAANGFTKSLTINKTLPLLTTEAFQAPPLVLLNNSAVSSPEPKFGKLNLDGRQIRNNQKFIKLKNQVSDVKNKLQILKNFNLKNKFFSNREILWLSKREDLIDELSADWFLDSFGRSPSIDVKKQILDIALDMAAAAQKLPGLQSKGLLSKRSVSLGGGEGSSGLEAGSDTQQSLPLSSSQIEIGQRKAESRKGEESDGTAFSDPAPLQQQRSAPTHISSFKQNELVKSHFTSLTDFSRISLSQQQLQAQQQSSVAAAVNQAKQYSRFKMVEKIWTQYEFYSNDQEFPEKQFYFNHEDEISFSEMNRTNLALDLSSGASTSASTGTGAAADYDYDYADDTNRRSMELNSSSQILDFSFYPSILEHQRVEAALAAAPLLSPLDKQLLWKYRKALKSHNVNVLKLASAVEWNNQQQCKAFEDLLDDWPLPSIGEALEMLSGMSTAICVRQFACRAVDAASVSDVLFYILQLVQAVRYDPPASTNLVLSVLLRKASASPIIASALYWALQCESEDSETGHVYIRAKQKLFEFSYRTNEKCIERRTANILELQKRLVILLRCLSSKLRDRRDRADKKTDRLRELLSPGQSCLVGGTMELHQLSSLPCPVPFPISPFGLLLGINPETSFVLKSSQYPLLLSCRLLVINDYMDESDDVYQYEKEIDDLWKLDVVNVDDLKQKGYKEIVKRYLYKSGDDLRQDKLVTQIIRIIKGLLSSYGADYRLTVYDVLPLSRSDGLVEFISNSEPLSSIKRSFSTLREYLAAYSLDSSSSSSISNNNSNKPGFGTPASATPASTTPASATTAAVCPQSVLDTFIRSCSGYSVITFLLGVGDRHLDNLLLCSDGRLFHVDFGFMFGDDPKPFPPPMKLCSEMIEGLGGISSEGYTTFQLMCCQCFRCIRRHSKLILDVLLLMAHSGIRGFRADPLGTIKRVKEKFQFDVSEVGAEASLLEIISTSANALFPAVVDKLHEWAIYWK